MNYALANAVMDVQIRSANFHLWSEEAISGDATIDIGKLWGGIEDAISLTESILNGGKTEHGLVLKPLRDSNLRTRVEELKSLLIKFRGIGHQRFQEPKAGGIGSALDDRFDAVFIEFQDKALSLEMIIEEKQRSDETISQRLFYGFFLVWISIVVAATMGVWSREVRRRHSEEALGKAKDQLEIRVAERTKELRGVNDRLRSLSSELLTAQEKERKRIAAELHDEIGASLAVLRIEFTLIENKLSEAQTELRERCRRNLEYIEQVADNVSRLSRNLSPYLLEDLGLSAALRSLFSNFSKRFRIRATLNIPEMDHLFPQDVETNIYRIIQESLTNIGKHAQARHVSMVTEIGDDGVRFIVEDDGKGFDPEQEIRKDPIKRGMGLTTMEERVRILGGSFDLWSQEGQGTRITFCIPKKNGGTFS